MRGSTIVFACVLAVLVPAAAMAIPTLQLYTPTGTYNTGSETWVATDSPFHLWVVGAASPAKVQYIKDVMLYVSILGADYSSSGSVRLTGEGKNVLLGFGGEAPDGTPSSSAPMQTHGQFPAYYWAVPLANLMVTTAGDSIKNYVDGTETKEGDIQDYEVTLSGLSRVHFDLLGTTVDSKGKTSSVFAPFSHDAETHPTTGVNIPEPMSASLLALALGALCLKARKRGR